MSEDNYAKVGLSADTWVKMWEDGFTHVHEGQEYYDEHGHDHHDETHGGDCAHGGDCGDHHCSEEHEGGCGDTVSEFDEHGHERKVDAFLARHITQFTGDDNSKSVLVSLCGESQDLEWLSYKGYSVVGVEISEKAVKQFFEKGMNGAIPFEVTTEGELKIYSATDGRKLKVYVSNFFSEEIDPKKLGTFDCIWDAHGIVSIPVPDIEPFAKKLLSFLKPGGKILFSTTDYDITKLKKGPGPVPVPSTRLQELFPKCEVKLLETKKLGASEWEGVDEWYNQVVLVTN